MHPADALAAGEENAGGDDLTPGRRHRHDLAVERVGLRRHDLDRTGPARQQIREPWGVGDQGVVTDVDDVRRARLGTGPQLDLATILPLVNPRLVSVPTMIIHGQYDDVADTDGLLPFFAQLPNPQKKYVIVPEAGHMMHLQKGHMLFQHEVVSFFKAP